MQTDLDRLAALQDQQQAQQEVWTPYNSDVPAIAVASAANRIVVPTTPVAPNVQQMAEEMSDEEALAILNNYFAPALDTPVVRPNICDWAEQFYYLAPGSSTESHSRLKLPIRLLPHQKALLNFFFHHPVYKWVTILFSTVKKSGKTAIGGLVARYFAENSGYYAEVYCMANDLEQARGRIYKAAIESIENTPGYDDQRKQLYLLRDDEGHIYRDNRNVPPGLKPTLNWRIIEREAQYTPTKSFMRALANDFRGEAGANPTATVWSEIWGLVGEKSRALWGELTPVPTRPSIRFVETYAGYEGESDILMDLWKRCQVEGRQLTKDEMPDWPFDGDPPVWINEEAQTCGYIDQGEQARRMPWQTAAYYQQQTHELAGDPISWNRFHLNMWASTVSELMPIQNYYDCNVTHEVRDVDGIILNSPRELAPLRKNERLVLSIDASTSSDYSAAALIRRTGPHKTGIMDLRVWRPPKGGKIDHTRTIESYIRWCAAKYNIAECCYDGYQMHKCAMDLEQEHVVNMVEFSQGSDRMKADQQLVQCFAERDIEYDTIFWDEDPELHKMVDPLEQAILNAAAQHDIKEDTKLRIIKRAKGSKIDPLIAVSMGNDRALYLNLW